MTMGPGDDRVAQGIGLREQEPEDRADTSGGRPDDQGHRGQAQQAATSVYDMPMVAFMVHG
jgi:hypothetical protein